MNTATQCIILLACAACTPATPILNCRCVRNSRAVAPGRIAHLIELPPRSYCNRKELIAVLKDGTSVCLDPNGKFAEAIEKYYQAQRARKATGPKTTGPITTSPKTTGPKTTATPATTARAASSA